MGHTGRQNLFLLRDHFILRPIEKPVQVEEPVFADSHLRRKDNLVRLLPFSDAVIRDLAFMIRELVQDDNAVLFAVFLDNHPKVARFGDQLPVHHWPRQQPHNSFNAVMKESSVHEPIRYQRRGGKPIDPAFPESGLGYAARGRVTKAASMPMDLGGCLDGYWPFAPACL